MPFPDGYQLPADPPTNPTGFFPVARWLVKAVLAIGHRQEYIVTTIQDALSNLGALNAAVHGFIVQVDANEAAEAAGQGTTRLSAADQTAVDTINTDLVQALADTNAALGRATPATPVDVTATDGGAATSTT